jgi:hypothetical protein
MRLARAATALALTAALAGAAGAAGAPTVPTAKVAVPAHVTPGRIVAVQVSGFAPGAKVHVQWGVYYNPPANCCISLPVPPFPKPGFTLATGAKTLHIRMPRRYAACPAAGCHDHALTPYKPGQRVFVFVSTDLSSHGPGPTYGKALSRIAR